MKNFQSILLILLLLKMIISPNLLAENENRDLTSNEVILGQDSLAQLNIPPRNPFAITGSEFMEKVENMSFADREEEIFKRNLIG